MKVILRKCGFFAAFTSLLLSILSIPAFADAADWDMHDYQSGEFRVVVQATDGSGYLYHRVGPSMDYPIICNIYDGTVLEINGSCEDASGGFRWGNTNYNGRWGWVSLKHTVSEEEYLAAHPSEANTEETQVPEPVVTEAPEPEVTETPEPKPTVTETPTPKPTVTETPEPEVTEKPTPTPTERERNRVVAPKQKSSGFDQKLLLLIGVSLLLVISAIIGLIITKDRKK